MAHNTESNPMNEHPLQKVVEAGGNLAEAARILMDIETSRAAAAGQVVDVDAREVTSTALTADIGLPHGATPAEILFVLGTIGDTSRAFTGEYPFRLHNAASTAFYRLTELVRARGLRNRTKLNAHGRYGRWTPGAQRQYGAAAALLTPAEIAHHAADFLAEWRRFRVSPARTTGGVAS